MVLDILSAFKIFLPTNIQTIREEPLRNKEKQYTLVPSRENWLHDLKTVIAAGSPHLSSRWLDWISSEMSCSSDGPLILGGINCLQLDAHLPVPHKMEIDPVPVFGSSTQDKSWPLSVGEWRREAAEATLSVSFLFRREQLSSSPGKLFGFWQCGVCLMTGMED